MASNSRNTGFLDAIAKARAYVSSISEPETDPTQSKRTPNRDTNSNDADNLERQMREDGHSKWGWVIYRCTYDSDEQWQAFLERFGYYVHATLEFHNGTDLQTSLDIQVHADRDTFEGATPDDVRQYFSHFVATASQDEQGRPAGLAQRYRYCLHVDQEALESVLAGPEPPGDELGDGYVNIVMLPPNFDPENETTELDANGEPKLDPNYMRISYSDLLVTWYNLLRPAGAWDTEYRQPPEIARP